MILEHTCRLERVSDRERDRIGKISWEENLRNKLMGMIWTKKMIEDQQSDHVKVWPFCQKSKAN